MDILLAVLLLGIQVKAITRPQLEAMGAYEKPGAYIGTNIGVARADASGIRVL